MTAVKVLFVIGQCIRLLNNDPWQSPTLKVVEVGKYSYLLKKNSSYYDNSLSFSENVVIPFLDKELKEDQRKYEAVPCTGESK